MRWIYIVALFCLCGCSAQDNFKKIVWQPGAMTPPLQSTPFSKVDLTVVGKKDKVVIERQFLDDIPIENSYIKKLFNRSGKIKFVNAKFVEQFSPDLRKSIQDVKNVGPNEWILKLHKAKPQLGSKKLVANPELAIVLHEGKLTPAIIYHVLVTDAQIESFVFDTHMNLLRSYSAGSNFQSVNAVAYPKGPIISPLSSVLLKSLINFDSLQSPQIQVSSESSQKVNMAEALNYAPPDERFDQVQVYYYLQEAIKWFESNLDIEAGRLKIGAITHLGYPDKTNAAFYFKGVIRLGSGDGESYSRMALDPSIVIHEAAHGLIEMLASLPYEGEGGSLNEGFADFLTTAQLNNPKLAEVAYKKGPFKRQVDILVPLKEKNGGLYHDSAIISSWFWKLKEKIGLQKSLAVSLAVLKKMAPDSNFKQFQDELSRTIVEELSGDDLKQATELYKIWSDS